MTAAEVENGHTGGVTEELFPVISVHQLPHLHPYRSMPDRRDNARQRRCYLRVGP